MNFLINRTNILEALKSENPKVMDELGYIGRLLLTLTKDCGFNPATHFITQLDNSIMFDDIFVKVIGNSNTFLMDCLTGEQGRGQHMCSEDELIFAHITLDDFPDAYKGIEKEYMEDFCNILVDNGFKEITDDLKHISAVTDEVEKDSRSFIYTVNKFGREFSPIFDQIIQYNIDLTDEEVRREEEKKDLNPEDFLDDPTVGYKYYVSYTYTRQREKGNTIGNMIVHLGDGPINTPEAIEALANYIEGNLPQAVKGSVMILGFSYMGIERYEEPEETEEQADDDYYLDEGVEEPQTEAKEEEPEEPSMLCYEITYFTDEDDYQEERKTRFASVIDLTKATPDQLKEVVQSYEELSPDINIRIKEVESSPLTPGEIPMKMDPVYDIEKHEDKDIQEDESSDEEEVFVPLGDQTES